jgi:hypothetical protein
MNGASTSLYSRPPAATHATVMIARRVPSETPIGLSCCARKYASGLCDRYVEYDHSARGCAPGMRQRSARAVGLRAAITRTAKAQATSE